MFVKFKFDFFQIFFSSIASPSGGTGLYFSIEFIFVKRNSNFFQSFFEHRSLGFRGAGSLLYTTSSFCQPDFIPFFNLFWTHGTIPIFFIQTQVTLIQKHRPLSPTERTYGKRPLPMTEMIQRTTSDFQEAVRCNGSFPCVSYFRTVIIRSIKTAFSSLLFFT